MTSCDLLHLQPPIALQLLLSYAILRSMPSLSRYDVAIAAARVQVLDTGWVDEIH